MPGLKSPPWPVRAVQLDLARQMETPATIRRFVDLAAEFGYNTLALYLEGRVRTVAFPDPSPAESYTPDEMREIVAYAGERGLDVLPIVSTLGHAELFLRHDTLKPLAELREGAKGRFGTDELCSFCPSVEETYVFFAAYLRDLAGIFPSEYIHIGCDEVWDMGCCSLCAQRLRDGERLDDLYARHVLRVHDIVTRELGRKVMMWDDFLEELPAVLDQLPTDIVQCVWQYDTLVEHTKSHFGRRRSDRRLADYDRRGISYIVASWAAQGVRNTETLTTYARAFHPRGGLLTFWDGDVLEDQHAALAFAGRRWSDPGATDGRTIGLRAFADLFGCKDSLLLEAVWTVTSMGPVARKWALGEFLCGAPTPYVSERINQARLWREVIASCREKVQRNGPVLEEIGEKLRYEVLQGEIQEVMEGLYAGWNGGWNDQAAFLARGRRALEELRAWAEDRRAILRGRYPGEPSGTGLPAQEMERKLCAELEGFLDRVERGEIEDTALMVVRYALPDFYGWPHVRWSVQYEDSSEWTPVFCGVPKPREGDYSDCPFYQHKLPISGRRPVRCAAVEVSGYGGIGLLYAEIEYGSARWGGSAVDACAGKIRDAGHLLVNDTSMCWLGESSTAEAFHRPAMAGEIASLQIRFAREREERK